MGKTTEKVNALVASMMRYRRKVSTATDIKQREDNQMEHRVAELVVEGSDEKWNNEALQATPIPKPMNPNGPTRKKKPKADANVKESVPVQVKAKESTGSLPKKKMKKRQLNDNKANNEVEIVMETLQEPLVLDAEGTKSKPVKQNSKRKNKSEANHINNKEPSLLKQLLWKPVAPPILSETLLTNEDCSLVTTTSPSSDEVAKQGHKVIKVKRMLRPSEDDEDEQAEVAYAVSERHNRKLEASKKVTLSHNTMSSNTCSTTAVIGGEISSQETQSGSDGEEATTEFLIAYEDLVPCNAIEPQDVVPSKAIEPQELSPAAHVDSFYPTAFPIALVSDGELLKQHGIKVHEILIEDFTFHPQQLRVQPGDVVVWKVSGETLGMVEHSLEATLSVRNSKSKKLTAEKATAPPLGNGSSFAWRFEKSSRVQIECSVYQAKGVILVGYAKLQKDKNTLVGKSAESMAQETAPRCPTTLSKPLTKQQKWKEKNAKRKQAAAAARVAEASRVGENERDRDTMEADVVFHPPHNLARSAEMDAGVCRAVLSQLEEVAAAVRAADVIVVGDVECPVLPEATINSISENPADYDPHHVHPDEKPSTMAEEWSGTEEDDDEDDERTSSLAEDNEIEDFQQRIIGMLKRSEEARAQHRWSFEQEKSGFDAGAAYDFFKQRFMRVQEERQIVYAMCPEQQSGCGVGLAEVVNLLSGSPA